jgi:hypothetical protein
VDRRPNRLFHYLFKTRQTRGIRHGFYRAFSRDSVVGAGTAVHLQRACRDLRI